MAAASDDAIKGVMDGQSDLMNKYGTAVDRESAFEIISGEAEKADEKKQKLKLKPKKKRKPSKKLKKQKRLPKKHKKKRKGRRESC